MITTGQYGGLTNMMFSKTSAHYYKYLCSLDVLGVREDHVGWDEVVHDKFKKQFSKNPDSWYEKCILERDTSSTWYK